MKFGFQLRCEVIRWCAQVIHSFYVFPLYMKRCAKTCKLAVLKSFPAMYSSEPVAPLTLYLFVLTFFVRISLFVFFCFED